MKVTTFSKIGATAGAACLLVGALAMPATADPVVTNPVTYGHLVGLGSDTTQDVVNGLAKAIGGNKIASYDATGSDSVVTRPAVGENALIQVPRAANSGSGRDLLRVAIGQASSGSATIPSTSVTVPITSSVVGQIDFARSSSGPTTADGTGALTYVPFAKDAVTVAVNPLSPLAAVPFTVTSAENHTSPSLSNVYRGLVTYAYVSGTTGSFVYQGVGDSSTVPVDAVTGTQAYKIQAYLPTAGSGTRSFFIGKLNALTEANITLLPAGTVKAVYGDDNLPVQEHNGSVVENDLTAIVPFSISQWVAQSNSIEGVNDRRHSAILLPLNGVAPITGTTTFSTNPLYTALTRDVYNIVPTRSALNPTTDIAKTFVGLNSLVCLQTATIEKYGFLSLPTTCGNTDLRGYPATNSAVTAATLDNATVTLGDSVTATVAVTDGQWDQGGVVSLINDDDEVVATADLAAGAESVDVELTPTEVGTITITSAEFTPTLPGIKDSSRALDATINTVLAPSVTSISAPASIKVGATVPVIVWVDGAAPAGGTVTLYDGETTLATKVLTEGEQGAYLTFVAKKVGYNLSATYTAPAGSNTSNSTSAPKAINFAKGTPVIKVGTIKTVSASSKSKFVVALTGVTGAVPTGTITIKEGSTVRVADLAISSTTGKVTVTMPKLKKGTHKVTITYSGDTNWATASKSSVVIKIK